MTRILLAFLLCCCGGVAQAAEPLMVLFRYATLIDGNGGTPVPDVDVSVEILDGEGWITSVIPSSTAPSRPPARALLVNARGKFLMPGLIDVHTHQRGGEAALAGYLYSGVTTVLDLGNQPEVILPLREAERARRIPSPRIFATGNLITASNGKNIDMGIAVSDAARDKALLEHHVAEQHPDFAKLVYDEGGWPGTSPVTLMPLETLRGVIAFYTQRKLRTFIHVVNEKRAREAIDAGVTALAHPVMEGAVSPEFVALVASRKIPFATTLTVGDNYERLVKHPEFLDRSDYAAVLSAEDRAALRGKTRDSYLGPRKALADYRMASMPVTKANIRKLVTAGGVAALGTDQSNGAAVHREMELLAEAGLRPLQIISIATVNAAKFLGKDDEMGAVEAGKRADILLLNADPTADIKNVADITLVMKDGRIIHEAQLPLAGGPKPTREFTQKDFHSP